MTTVIEKVKPREVAVDPRYTQTVNRILLPEENASFLWGANERGFRKVERYMVQRQEHGKSSPPQLIRLLSSQTVTREGEVGTSAKEAKDLQQANGKSWKRTAVSLIHLMIGFYNGHQDDSDIIENAMQCYIRALEYMNFVDGLDEEVKSLGRQADKEFKSLQHFWPNRKKEPTRTTEDIQLFIRTDTTDVANECLFKTKEAILHYCSASESNKVDLLQSKLAKVYSVNMTEDLNEAVLQKCSKLAEECMEEEILAVAILAAKAQAVLEKARVEARRRPPVPQGGPPGPQGGPPPGGPPGPPGGPPDPPAGSPAPSPQGGPSPPAPSPQGGPSPPGAPSTSSHSPTAGVGPGGQASTTSDIPTVGKGNSQAGLRPIDIRVNSRDRNVIRQDIEIELNPIFDHKSIRLRRPNDSLTDQTEFVPAPKDDKPKEE